MKGIFKAEDVPENEEVYLKKDLLGWRVVHPIKKDLDKPLSLQNVSWFNFLTGGWNNLLILFIMVITIVSVFWFLDMQYSEVVDYVEKLSVICKPLVLEDSLQKNLFNNSKYLFSDSKLWDLNSMDVAVE